MNQTAARRLVARVPNVCWEYLGLVKAALYSPSDLTRLHHILLLTSDAVPAHCCRIACDPSPRIGHSNKDFLYSSASSQFLVLVPVLLK